MQQELFVRGQDPEPVLHTSSMGEMSGMAGMGADSGSHEMHEMSTPSGIPASGS